MKTSIQEEYAQKEQYIISDTKTKLMTINERNDTPNQQDSILNGKEHGTVEEYKYIGVNMHSNLKIANKCLVEERTKSARRAAYALMGAGFHGQNGLNPKVSKTIYNLYVLPCLLYELETVILLLKDVDILNDFRKDMLRVYSICRNVQPYLLSMDWFDSFQLNLS